MIGGKVGSTVISSLPSRPLAVDELKALHMSNSILAAAPINVVFDPEPDRQRSLVVSAVIATEKSVIGVSYDPAERTWERVIRRDNAPESEMGTDNIADGAINKVEQALEAKAEQFEEENQVSEIVESDTSDGVTADLREADELSEVLQQQYEDAS